jgi:Leucine-rich repeat (LRR) protein
MKTKQNINSSLMKNIFLLLLLFTGMVKAQIVNIPDANFKARLLASSPSVGVAVDISGNAITIDTNNDNEIQVSEALSVYGLRINSSQTTQIVGLESFQNLTSFDCSNTLITSLDVSFLPNLKTLFCNNATLSTINVAGLTNLEGLYCSGNQLTLLDVSNLINLQNVLCNDNLITTINLVGSVNLYQLTCTNNLLTTINLQGLTTLTLLYIDYNQVTSLSLNGLSSLRTLVANDNQISSLEIINCPIIEAAGFSNNLLSNINLGGTTNIKALFIANNNFTDVSFITSLSGLKHFNCVNNSITNLDFVGSIANLEYLICSNNLITTLDVSNNSRFISLGCANNPNLISVNLKFGRENTLSIPGGYPLNNNPNLRFVCVDDFRVSIFSDYFIQNNMPNVVVNSYCSFTPGGNHNTITGNIKFDSNNNGCDTNDIVVKNVRVNINDGSIQGASFTNAIGNYSFYTQGGSFGITPSLENPTWFNFSPPTANISLLTNNNNTATQDFCISPNGFHPDVEVVISPILFARPGFDATYQITYRNKGNQTFSEGLVGLQYDDTVLDYVSTSQAVFSQAVGNINWQYTNLLPFESRTITVTLNVNSPTETPAVNIGDLLNFVVSTFPLEADENPLDNTFEYIQTVVGSYDPNDITCLEGDVVAPSEIGNYLHYAINFENTGNFPAENVVVKTDVDAAKFDIGSLQLMNTNFPVDARITGNKVEFIFKNIQLPIGGHGHILLKIKTNETLVVGDAVANRADIFFDYNFPIDTGMANTVFQTLSNSVFEVDSSVTVYPNPAVNNVTVNADNKIKSIQLYDAQGRIIMTSLIDDLESKLDISSYSKGIYFIKIITEKGAQVQKLLKD